MVSAEHEPIMGVWGSAPSGVQGLWFQTLNHFTFYLNLLLPSVLLRCWMDGRKGIQPVVGWCIVICLERGADFRMAQLMLLPLTVFCFNKIPAHQVVPVKWVCVLDLPLKLVAKTKRHNKTLNI